MKNFDFKTIKTFEDACKKLSINVEAFNKKFGGFDIDTIAREKLKIIYKAINDGWIPDYSNDKEEKYYPWFEWNMSSGFSFYYSGYAYCSGSSVGSLLSTNTKEKSDYIGKQFINLYNQMFGYSDDDVLIDVKITKKKAIQLGLL